MTGEIMNTTTKTAIIPEIWSARFFEVLKSKLPFIDLVAKDYENEITDLGDTVNISTIPEFDEATELAEGAAGSTEAVTLTSQALIINKRTYKDYIVTKKAQLQSLPFMDALRDLAVYSIQKRMQTLIINSTSPSTSSPDHVISYDSGTTLGLADLLEIKELLDTADVPDDAGVRNAVFGPAQLNDLFNVGNFTSKDYLGSGDGSPSTSGKIESDVLGFVPRWTTAITDNTSYYFHSSYMNIALQQGLNIEVFNLGSEGVRAARVNLDILWGLKQTASDRVATLA